MSQKVSNRDAILDIIKFLSILLVITGHFIDDCSPSLFYYWKTFPYSLLLGGMDALLGVSAFSLISGHLAYKSGQKEALIQYVVKRYISFLIYCFFANSLVYLFNLNGIADNASFGFVIGESIVLGDAVFETLWFVRPFFMGMILSFIFGKHGMDPLYLLVSSLIILYLGHPFVGLFLLGGLLDKMTVKNNKILDSSIIRIVLLLCAFTMIKFKDCDLANYSDGIAILILIWLIKKKDMGVFNGKNFFALLGSQTFSALITHVFAIRAVIRMAQAADISLILQYVLCLILTFVSAFILDKLIKPVVSIFTNTLLMITESLC